MHELLLFGQVPAQRHDQVLKILAGIAAMQPHVLAERHLIFKPRRPIVTKEAPKPGQSVSQVQALQKQLQGDLFYLQLVGNMSNLTTSRMINSVGSTQEDGTVGGIQSQGTNGNAVNGTPDRNSHGNITENMFKAHPWSIEFRDIPEPGKRQVTTRLMASIQVTDGDPLRVVEALGYNYSTEYVMEGTRLIHGNIILLFHRPLVVPVPADQVSKTPQPANPIPPISSLKPLDASGGYILQASIRVQDGTKPETLTIATNELTRFKDLMNGVVSLAPADRLALDTRMR